MRRIIVFLLVLSVVPLYAKKKAEIPPLSGVQPDDAWALAKVLSDEEGCSLLGFDYGKGVVVFGKVEFRDLLTRMRSNVLFRLQDGLLDVELVDMEEQARGGYWEKSALTLTKSHRKVRERILARMHELYDNPEQFNRMREKAYADIDLHYLFLRTATELACDRWVEKFMLGKAFNWNVTFVDIEKNKDKGMAGYKYVETYSYGGKGRIESYDNVMSYRHFYIKIFTNSDRNIMQQKDMRARAAGVCRKVVNHEDSFSVVMSDG